MASAPRPRLEVLLGAVRVAGLAGLVVVAAALIAACSSEMRPQAGAEACLGASPPPVAVDKAALGLPAEEPDMQAWVVKEQSGLLAVTTRPCAKKPPTRLLRVPADIPVMRAGEDGKQAAIPAGSRVSVWFAGGSSSTARAVLIERKAEAWPPGQ